MEIIKHIGNVAHLKLFKTAFFCSRQIPALAVLKCYDWAIAQREAGNCIISGFHSQIEKDVLHYLLKGTQPIIVVLARGLKQQVEPELQESLHKGQLLIITPFKNDVIRVTEKTAAIRNSIMLALANEFVIGSFKKGGMLEKVIKETNKKGIFLNN